MPEKLIPGEDYYFNQEGKLVFTEKYHLKRGTCCQSGCLHCPYGFKKENKNASSSSCHGTSDLK